jgi:hypothetical protein
LSPGFSQEIKIEKRTKYAKPIIQKITNIYFTLFVVLNVIFCLEYSSTMNKNILIRVSVCKHFSWLRFPPPPSEDKILAAPMVRGRGLTVFWGLGGVNILLEKQQSICK